MSKNFYLLILYMKIINVDVSRLPPAALIIDVIPKESKSKIGRLNNLGFENQKIKE